MSLFSNPDEHAANPPETWEVAKVWGGWALRTKDGATVTHTETKRAALAQRADGFYVRLYEQERRWYAGETVSGWRPYAGRGA